MKKGIWWVQAGLSLVLTLLIIGVSVIGTLAFRPLYYADMEKLHIAEESGYSKEQIRENYDALIAYNMAWEDGELSFPTLPMSETGKIHFEEVKEIFDFFKYLAVFGGVFGLVGIVVMARLKEYRYLKMTAIVSCALPVVLALLVAAFWDQVFVIFHELFFNNDYWIFNPSTDPVITILPDEFFMHCALMIFGGVLLGAVVCMVVYSVIKHRENRQNEEV
ncbi:MAG: TIGR01906 family membrane protein [Lachnospiraceae bacterium]|nr:TIGR01906 family membrane protein [Lachnospiraceae bacterium]